MNTKLLMMSSSLFLGATGICLTFLPAEVQSFLTDDTSILPQVVLQLLGATYFSFAMVNWMAKSNLIGGIYSRPIAIGNFTHFIMGSFSLLKIATATPKDGLVWPLAAIYVLFALLFGYVTFTHPLKSNK